MLYLASQSPRRRQLLEQLGVEFEVLDVDVPEVRVAGESAGDYVSRVAREKAHAGWLKVAMQSGARVLGADTEVVLGDRVFGKPQDATHACAMLRELAGHTHQVISVVWLVDGTRAQHALSISEVTFAELDDADIAAYVATGEAFGKAGAYAIQGRAGAFVQHLNGSFTGVMGLPVYETSRLLRTF